MSTDCWRIRQCLTWYFVRMTKSVYYHLIFALCVNIKNVITESGLVDLFCSNFYYFSLNNFYFFKYSKVELLISSSISSLTTQTGLEKGIIRVSPFLKCWNGLCAISIAVARKDFAIIRDLLQTSWYCSEFKSGALGRGKELINSPPIFKWLSFDF